MNADLIDYDAVGNRISKLSYDYNLFLSMSGSREWLFEEMSTAVEQYSTSSERHYSYDGGDRLTEVAYSSFGSAVKTWQYDAYGVLSTVREARSSSRRGDFLSEIAPFLSVFFVSR